MSCDCNTRLVSSRLLLPLPPVNCLHLLHLAPIDSHFTTRPKLSIFIPFLHYTYYCSFEKVKSKFKCFQCTIGLSFRNYNIYLHENRQLYYNLWWYHSTKFYIFSSGILAFCPMHFLYNFENFKY